MAAYLGFQCTGCKKSYAEDAGITLSLCPNCSAPIDTLLDTDALQEHSRDALNNELQSMWRFRAFLPVTPKTRIISAGEGGTPLRRMASFPGRVWAKDETHNPTGTFKDRGASLTITCLSSLGVGKVVLSSEGNAGCSFALYANMASIHCHVFMPRLANPAKVELSKKLGAKVFQVNGTIADAGRKAGLTASKTGAYNASTFVTPYRHDGKGTMALEICEAMGWKSPDWVVYPIGGGVGLVGMWKMFKILERIGWIRTKPRLVGVQPSGCAPVVKAYNARKEEVEEWKTPKTIALGLRIPKPLAGRWIIQSLRESGGIACTVTDQDIHASMRRQAKDEGLLLEPSSAAAFAALPPLYEDGVIDNSDEVVVVATGSALKTLEALPRP